MTRQNRLVPIIKLRQRHEQQAGKRLQETSQFRQQHLQLVEQLQGYREGYLQQMEDVLKKGIAVNDLGNYRAMLAELDEALSKQKEALQWAESDWQLARKVWQQAHSQVEALSGLSRQYARNGQLLADRQEQDHQEDVHRNRSQ